jgi:hypothetical protein
VAFPFKLISALLDANDGAVQNLGDKFICTPPLQCRSELASSTADLADVQVWILDRIAEGAKRKVVVAQLIETGWSKVASKWMVEAMSLYGKDAILSRD